MQKLSVGILFFFLLTSCGMQHPVQTAIHQYKTQTPPEYYHQLQPANFAPEGTSPKGSAATSSETSIPETKSDHSHAIMIGLIAGAVAVAGAVVPLVLLNK